MRRRGWGWLAIAVALAGIVALVAAVAAPLPLTAYRGAVSDHFDGTRFFNPEGERGTGGAQRPTLRELFDQATGHDHHAWPTIAVTPTVPSRRIDGAAMRVTWIGHASTLVQTQGLNILLDPVWADRDSPVPFAGPKRVRAPGVRLADLPRIDLILLSHDHYDHFDVPTLEALWRRDRPLIVTGLGNDALLRRHGIAAIGRDWGNRVTVRPGIDVIVERAHHWSGRGLLDRDRTLWCGFTVTLPGGDLYYAGDTGPAGMEWADAAARHGPIRLAILPIGAFKPGRAESGNHISPVEAVDAFARLHAASALGVHWGTFELTNEGVDEPATLLAATLRARGIAPGRFRTLAAGAAWDIAAIPDQPAADHAGSSGMPYPLR